jgi:uncharacterized Ntn-hydrolase superfamily protein
MSPRRTLLPLLLVGLLALPSRATWSIVCVDLETREVGVASATCIASFNLKSAVPVVYVGEGAAAAQSFIDQGGDNRRLIFLSFRDTDETPLEILERLEDQDPGHETRQYGIVNFTGAPLTFTGRQAGEAATGVTGRVEDLLYAVQGNILVGNEVVFAAEQAFRDTKGDMGQRLMAAMEAARALGGDGRCSCSERAPTSCGVPPPDFEKSAHCGFVIVARLGDANGACNGTRGCAQGEYYLDLNVRGALDDPDPVFTLQERYKLWRQDRLGRPDGVLSRVEAVQKLPADGLTERTVVVRLRDLEDQPLTHGGALVAVATADGLPSLATVGPVVDREDGSYAFTLRAGTELGTDRFVITAADELVRARLVPELVVHTTAATPLHAGLDELSVSAGGELPFVLSVPERPRAGFLIVARLAPPAGRGRGLVAGGRSPILTLDQEPFFPGRPGELDGSGRAEAVLALPPGVLAPLAGARLEFEAWVMGRGTPLVTNTVGVELAP